MKMSCNEAENLSIYSSIIDFKKLRTIEINLFVLSGFLSFIELIPLFRYRHMVLCYTFPLNEYKNVFAINHGKDE